MNIYIAETRYNGRLVERMRIEAPDRGTAVHKVQLHFWDTTRGKLGTVDKAVVVNDPYDEIQYSDTFHCRDRKNLLLPEHVIVRLLQQAHGELIRDVRIGSPCHPPCSVRRVKRRRDLGTFIAPGVRQMRNGKLYYRINTRRQVVRNGRRYHKRKYKDIPLVARTLAGALEEIRTRGLVMRNAEVQRKRLAWRDMRVLEWLANVVPLPARMSPRFRSILKYYAPSTVVA